MNKLFNNRNLIVIPKLESTNQYANELILKSPQNEGTVIMALNQHKGRGLNKNTWESESGKNLTISIIFKPNFLSIENQFYLSMAISLGIRNYISRYVDDIKIKWPNDIYANNKKICGILIENTICGAHLEYSICGIGININQENFISDAPNPISLKNITSQDYDLKEQLSLMLADIEAEYKKLANFEYNYIKAEYLKSLYLINEDSYFKDLENNCFKGRITGINDIGQLLIESNNETKIFNFKEVEYLHATVNSNSI
ncbi:MAG: biotin--[acetyl-CoA-carboxylase] ligase [Marinifilaceae bacterium]|jgi:BirA family biotin operon repressor/biotin-[acetyl-CoA-carboxylase] ligase|nr:biotin--[acetyl-CoA-carboxylase] ligase [Marinifilaceae bacterium]